MLFDITWKCACKMEQFKPSDNIIHGHSHSMNMSMWTRKADNLKDGCIMVLKTNSRKYAFISCYFILHYRHHIVFFLHTTHYSHLLENDVIKQQNRKFAYFCIVWSSKVSQLFHLYCLVCSVLFCTELLPLGYLSLCMGVFRELVDCMLTFRPSSSENLSLR